METAIMIKSDLSTFLKANMANGTNIIKETSLVMNMEVKKHVKTKNKTSPLVFLTLTNNLRTNISKIDKFLRTSTMNMITKSNIIVSQLI
jgi:hypothetical protein